MKGRGWLLDDDVDDLAADDPVFAVATDQEVAGAVVMNVSAEDQQGALE